MHDLQRDTEEGLTNDPLGQMRSVLLISRLNSCFKASVNSELLKNPCWGREGGVNHFGENI